MQNANPWQDAMVDEAIVTWCLSEAYKDDPQMMLRDIIATNIEWDRDPRISHRPLLIPWFEIAVIVVCLLLAVLL